MTPQFKPLLADGQRFIDQDGRQVLLRGINFVNKKKSDGYVMPANEALFSYFREAGFNCLRFGLQWDGVEPQPGDYDDRYLARLKQQISWAATNSIYIFLDMHQDLYGIKYGDGAPEWATLDRSLDHTTGDLWSDAYLMSDALNAAFDAFWANDAGPSGIGLQDRFLSMWQHAATYFADCPNVIGFDLYNEPYPGSGGRLVFGSILAEAGGLSLWTSEAEKSDLLGELTDMDLYAHLAKAAEPLSQVFEQETLLPFYDKLEAGIKEIAPHWLSFRESSYFTNIGIETGITADTSHGQVFAPHAYDLVVDTDLYESYSQDRVAFILASHRRAQERMDVPVVMGEWGAFNHRPITAELTAQILDLFDAYHWSHTYWCWYEGADRSPYWPILTRAYPQIISGKLVKIESKPNMFQVEYDAVPGETILYHPSVAKINPQSIEVHGQEVRIEIRPYAHCDAGIILIHSTIETPITVKMKWH